MKEKDIDYIIEENRELSKDIASIVTGESSIEECQQLMIYLSDEDNYNNFIHILEDIGSADDITEQVKGRNKIEDKELLLHRLTLLSRQRSLRIRKQIAVVVGGVAAVLLLSLMIWMVFDNINHQTPVTAEYRVFKPTLFLDNGDTISLTETNQDTIQALKMIIGNTDNKLSYRLNDTLSLERDTTRHQLAYNTLVVPAKFNYNLILSDSSEVFLNAGSKIKYPIYFGATNREVWLEGEAYFKVNKDARPFVVKAGDLSIRVYGTEFNVNYIVSMNSVKTVLAKGSVGVTKLGLDKEFILTPNQMFLVEKGNSVVKDVVAKDYSSWIDGLFRYKKEPLKGVLNDLSLWYGIRFNINVDIEDLTVTMTAKRTDSADEIISFIATIINKTIIKEGKEVYTIE